MSALRCNSFSNPWPTPDQLLLLRACVEEGEVARQAWETWSATADLDRLDPQSTYLLPMLDRSLRLMGVASHPWLGRIKGYHRYVWARNRQLFSRAAQLIKEMRHFVGDELLLIKGAALACQYYSGPGMRPMGDFDLMIRREAAPSILQYLCDSGWKLSYWGRSDLPPERYFFYRHSENICRKGGADVDVHWHLMDDLCGTASSQIFWDGAVSMHLPDGTEVRTLERTDLLFHACLHGLHWHPVPPTLWIVDALVLLQNAEAVKWKRLTDLADRFRYSLPLGSALNYLASAFPLQAKIPEPVIRYLLERDHSKDDVAEHEGRMRGDKYPRSVSSYYRSFRLRSLPSGIGWARETRAFLEFVASRWSLPNLWLVLIYAPARAIRRVFRRFSPGAAEEETSVKAQSPEVRREYSRLSHGGARG